MESQKELIFSGEYASKVRFMYYSLFKLIKPDLDKRSLRHDTSNYTVFQQNLLALKFWLTFNILIHLLTKITLVNELSKINLALYVNCTFVRSVYSIYALSEKPNSFKHVVFVFLYIKNL